MMKKLFLPAVVAAALLAAMFSAPALAQSGEAAAIAPAPMGTASPRDPGKYWPDGELLPDKIKGDSAILLDARTGKVLFEKNADDKRYPASTTKIMTCLLALESGKDFSDIVTIGALPKADFINGSENIGLKSGEKISFGDLMAGMMVYSGNDAADAVAISVGGSIADFVEMMNQKAQELGMTGTHYTCTNGLADDTEHYTTPRDMAKLAMAAVKYPEFVKLVSKDSYTMQPDNVHPSPTAWTTTNHLLLEDDFGYMFATGIKTGYTSMAQNSLVSSAERDGMSLIAVDMHVKDRNPDLWVDGITMFEFGFNNYATADLQALLSSRTIPLDVKGAAGDDPGQGKLEMHLKPQGPAYITDRTDAINDLKADPSKLRYELSVEKDAAPITGGEKLGTVTYLYNDEPVLTCDLLASRDVALPTPAPTASVAPTGGGASGKPAESDTAETGGFVTALIWVAVAVLVLALAALLIRFVNLRRRGGRYRRGYDYRQGGGTPRMRR
jgi:D-alanyl-D-alanine carboxypeptidase (penicillin-binding protein 5/6)